MSLNIAMMATGEFALPTLRAFVQSDHHVVALITQPDRVNPRGKAHPHPLKEFALTNGLTVHQPESINTPESIELLNSLNADVIAVAAYGQILKADVINVPRLGTFNLHGSLLPRHRGAAPVQYALWKGDTETGVTIFQIIPKLDAGPMLVRLSTPIRPDETAGELHDRLAILGADAFLEAIAKIETGDTKPLPQNDDDVTQCPKITKQQGEIDWSGTRHQIDCHRRAMLPWPKPFTFLHRAGKPPERLLILEAVPCETPTNFTLQPGELMTLDQSRLLVQTGDGPLSLRVVQKAGKKPMHIGDFLRGHPITAGDYLGSED